MAGIERRNEAFEGSLRYVVQGPRLEVGYRAPNFSLIRLNPDGDPETVTLQDSKGKVRLLLSVNAAFTNTCGDEACDLNDFMSEQLSNGLWVAIVSTDLPWDQEEWRKQKGIKHQVLSGAHSESFGINYGVQIRKTQETKEHPNKPVRLNFYQRALWVIGPNDLVVMSQYCADQAEKPDLRPFVDKASELAILQGVKR